MITEYALREEPRLFIALLGHAPDGASFANYAYAFEANQPLKDIASWMYYDYQPSQYPSSMSHAQIAAKFYTNIYGHAPTDADLAPWTARLDAWESPSSVMVDMIAGLVNYGGTNTATLQSQALFANKVAVAVYYASYGGDELGVSAVLQPVTSDPDSVLDAIHAMKGHWHIPADAPDPDGSPAPAEIPDPVIKDGLPAHADELAQLYLAYFGRPMDWDGIDFYTAGGHSLDLFALARGFSESPESQQLYGTTFGATQVNAIYQNLFNRDAEADGVAYWTGEVNAGRLTAAGAALAILLGAQNADKTSVANKMQVALAFSAHVDTQSEVDGYAGAQAAASARSFLHSVSATTASLNSAMSQIDAQVAAAVDAGAHAQAQDPVQLIGVAPADSHTG